MQFEAHEIEYSADRILAKAAFRSLDSHYLILTRGLQPTEQDTKLGHDQIHIELDDQVNSTYGGVALGTFYPERLELALNNRSSGNVGTTIISVSFSLPPERLVQLRDIIGLLFEGHPTFATVA